MDYLNESEQISITQIVTAYVFCLMVCALSLNASLHSKSLLIAGAWTAVAVATIASVVYYARKINASLNA